MGQLVLPGLRELLHPAVVHQRDRQHALPAHARVGRHLVVGRALRIRPEGEKNAAHDSGVRNVAVIVGIGVDDDQVVRELARDVGVVAAALLRAEVHAVASGTAGQDLDQFVGARIDDGNRPGQRGGR